MHTFQTKCVHKKVIFIGLFKVEVMAIISLTAANRNRFPITKYIQIKYEFQMWHIFYKGMYMY